MVKEILKTFSLSITLIPLIASSQNNLTYLPPDFIDKDRLSKIKTDFPAIAKIYKIYAEKNHIPGYAFGIMLDGKLVYSGSGGYADINKKIPATTHSMFRIASMTKSFTAMAILKLRDEGKLKLDDPLMLYLPEIKNQQLTQDAPVITLRNLLTHSAGLPSDDPWGDRQLSRRDDELLALYKNGIAFSNDAGTIYEYSNLGFATLGYVIKKISGMPYEEYIAKNIWQPLELTQAEWEFSKIPADQLVHGYKWHAGKWEEEKLLHDGAYGAMGGMITSIESFAKYVALHQSAWPPRDDVETGPIKRSSIREMHQPWNFQELVTQSSNADGHECAVAKAYGFGLHWERDCQKKTYILHSGGLPGFGSNWTIMPEYGIGVIFFANATYAPAQKVNLRVLDLLIKRANLQPRQLPPSPILKQRQAELIKLLPTWKNAASTGIFAENFFLDNSLNELKQKSAGIFAQAGKILRINAVIPENQLKGYFILEGEKADIRIDFALNEQNPALIQKYEINMAVKELNDLEMTR